MGELIQEELIFNDKIGWCISSRLIAEKLNKVHRNVLRDIDGMLKSEHTPKNLIISSSYKNSQNKQTYKEYLLTKDGFILYMFNIQGFQDFKMAYIQKFNEMEKALQNPLQISESNDWVIRRIETKTQEIKLLEDELTEKVLKLRKLYEEISALAGHKGEYAFKNFLEYKDMKKISKNGTSNNLSVIFK